MVTSLFVADEAAAVAAGASEAGMVVTYYWSRLSVGFGSGLSVPAVARSPLNTDCPIVRGRSGDLERSKIKICISQMFRKIGDEFMLPAQCFSKSWALMLMSFVLGHR